MLSMHNIACVFWQAANWTGTQEMTTQSAVCWTAAKVCLAGVSKLEIHYLTKQTEQTQVMLIASVVDHLEIRLQATVKEIWKKSCPYSPMGTK